MKFMVRLQAEEPETEMSEEEFRDWLDMFMADKSMGSSFMVQRRFR
ncbi:hypothetical protein SEA_FEDE_14 [Microbacterium phage Fede]|nr:hypothetical protein SEA_FEDE_14 [Microbacterium phage Fede]